MGPLLRFVVTFVVFAKCFGLIAGYLPSTTKKSLRYDNPTGSIIAARHHSNPQYPVFCKPTTAIHYHSRSLFQNKDDDSWSPAIGPNTIDWPSTTGSSSTATSTMLNSAKSSDDGESSNTTTSSAVKQSLISASMLVFLDVMFRQIMRSFQISFPSSLVGCGALFASLLIFQERLYRVLSPGAALLAKWLPVFFVPSLVTLPLTDTVGSVYEIFKVASIIVGGFYFTLLSTAWSVVGIRKLISSNNNKKSGNSVVETTPPEPNNENNNSPALAPTPPKPFSDKLNNILRLTTLVTGAASLLVSRCGLNALYSPLSSIFMLSLTLTSFVFGARLPKQFTKIVHPLVTCTSLVWFVLSYFGKVTGKTFTSLLKSYRTGKMQPLCMGGGDLLIFLLGPAVISLACQMYERRKLMRENLVEVATGISVSTFGGIFGTAAAVRIFGIASPYLRLSLLSRNITSPLAMAIASILGADVSLAVSMVVVTGLIGANFGATILNSFGIEDAVARGLGIGAAAHGLGTAAFVTEEDAFPFAAISMALTASAATVVVSIPFFKRSILQLALG